MYTGMGIHSLSPEGLHNSYHNVSYRVFIVIMHKNKCTIAKKANYVYTVHVEKVLRLHWMDQHRSLPENSLYVSNASFRRIHRLFEFASK